MTYFKIIDGRYKGLIGRIVDDMNGLYILLVQTRDQWLFAYVNENQFIKLEKWELRFSNETNYIVERP